MRLTLPLCLFLLFTSLGLTAQEAAIHGHVHDESGDPLIGATVRVVGSVIAAATDLEGDFELEVPPGRIRLLVTYISFENFDTLFNVRIDERKIEMDIMMRTNFIEVGEVIVFGRRNVGQSQALRAQQSAIQQQNIIHSELFNKYPDVTLAETVQRMPGVTISRGQQGDDQQAQVRGLPGQYTTVLLNGQRMPSIQPQADRAGNLDLIQSNLVDEVRVIKSRTANLDGDAIGGTVDFRLRQAEEQFELLLQAGIGQNFGFDGNPDQATGVTQLAGVINSEVRDESLYALAGGSYFRHARGNTTDLYEGPGGRQNTDRRRLFDLDRVTAKTNLVGAIELRPSIYNRARLSYNFSRSRDDYRRYETSTTNSNDRPGTREGSRWTEERDLNMATLEVENNFNKFRLDYDVSFASTRAGVADRTRNVYLRSGPDTWSFDHARQEEIELDEDIAIGSLNLTRYVSESKTSFLRVGLRYRIKDRLHGHLRRRTGELPAGTAPSVSFMERAPLLDPFLDTQDPLLSGTAFDTREEVAAAYLMYTANWTSRFSSSVGLRYEYTGNRYVITQPAADTVNFDYNDLFPSVNLTYRLSRSRQLRLGFYEAISRPAYANYFQGEQFLTGFGNILGGNLELEPTRSRNVDLSYERYGRRDGFFEIGVYAKFLDQPTVPFVTYLETDNEFFLRSEVRNLEGANLLGAELGFYENLGFLSPALRFINVNGTYNFNAFQLESDNPEFDDLPLSNAPRQSANLSLVYSNPNKRLNVVLAGTFRDRILNRFQDGSPVYFNSNVSVDISADVNLFKGISAYFRLNNLTDYPYQEWLGEPNDDDSVLRSKTRYGVWGVAGVRLKR